MKRFSEMTEEELQELRDAMDEVTSESVGEVLDALLVLLLAREQTQ